MKISAAAWDVFADILTTFAGILLFAIPGYALVQDWFRLTSVLVLVY
ncbi:MAG: hypothetical protein JO266_22855 [Acidobacteria bacterium]|nr:hypothetical protein [Acidobacteriota bacterium]